MNKLKKTIRKAERGQIIIIIVFAFVGLVAMVGLVTDTGLALIEYGKLKKAIDAAAVAAAQEYRPDPDTGNLNTTAIENAAVGFLQLNQMENLTNLTIHTCEDTGADRPALCNPDPSGHPENNRKLVEVSASTDAALGFLRVVGIPSITLSASAVGEAATIDLVLIMDTSASMSFETGTELNDDDRLSSDEDDDPSVCNLADDCQPMRAVKDIALDFVNSMIYFGYDRVSVISMTSQTAGGKRYPTEVLPLSFSKNTILNSIDDIKVFEPRDCDGTETEGACLEYVGGTFNGSICQIFELVVYRDGQNPDPSSCPSSNVGGVLSLAQQALTGSSGKTQMRTQALWVVVALLGGPANATDTNGSFPNGFCPENTWLNYEPYFQGPWCRDPYPSVRHSASATTSYTHSISGVTKTISIYDADDFARDSADNLAASKTNTGVTIYTIGLGIQIRNPARNGAGNLIAGEPPPAEDLLEYIALDAGNSLNPDIDHGQYFFAPKSSSLKKIFELIAQNIATKISQ
ncbi:hypothetical protein MASR2M66_33730 [Chloroflexota bacterium]